MSESYGGSDSSGNLATVARNNNNERIQFSTVEYVAAVGPAVETLPSPPVDDATAHPFASDTAVHADHVPEDRDHDSAAARGGAVERDGNDGGELDCFPSATLIH